MKILIFPLRCRKTRERTLLKLEKLLTVLLSVEKNHLWPIFSFQNGNGTQFFFEKGSLYLYLPRVKATYAYMFESVLFQRYLILSKPIGQAMFDQRQILKVKFWLQLLVVLLGLTNPKAGDIFLRIETRHQNCIVACVSFSLQLFHGQAVLLSLIFDYQMFDGLESSIHLFGRARRQK